MYKSNLYNYLSIKYIPVFFGTISLLITMWIFFDSSLNINENGIECLTEISDCIIPLLFGLFFFAIYYTLSKRFVRMRMNNNILEYKIKGKKTVRNWHEIESIKKYWLVAPPIYSVKFDNEDKKIYFTTGFWFITTPFYVFDLSEMGTFIMERRKDISILKTLNIK